MSELKLRPTGVSRRSVALAPTQQGYGASALFKCRFLVRVYVSAFCLFRWFRIFRLMGILILQRFCVYLDDQE